MIDPEARGVLARLAVVEHEIEQHAADLKAASAKHWKHLYEHELYASLRRKDELTGQLLLIQAQGRKIK